MQCVPIGSEGPVELGPVEPVDIVAAVADPVAVSTVVSALVPTLLAPDIVASASAEEPA